MTSHSTSILERAGLVSDLLSQDQINRARLALGNGSALHGEKSGANGYDQRFADWLVAEGVLNRWQAEQLLRGRTKFNLGPYRIIDAIGYGGMGYVFKGEHSLLGRIEAIKVLPRSQMDPASIASFRREIRAQAQLDHPNLVRLSFADKEGDTYYLVTEFVPGSDLRRLVRFHGPLSPRQAAVVISQAAEALAFAHARGLVHRDVKPGNMLVTPEGRTKLTDLGLASFASDVSRDDDDQRPDDAQTKSLVGTPDFVAPESIVAPSEVRCVSDIYSLGCTLYYAVTGKVPFPGGKTRDKLRRHLEETPITPLRFAPHVDRELVDVIADMMAKQPERRIAAASEVVERLRPWASQADAKTWQELGRYALEPGERSYAAAGLADTSPAVTRGSLVSDVSMGSTGKVGLSDSNNASDPCQSMESPDAREIPYEQDSAALDFNQRLDGTPPDSPVPAGLSLGEPTGLAFFVVVLLFASLVIGLSAVTLW